MKTDDELAALTNEQILATDLVAEDIHVIITKTADGKFKFAGADGETPQQKANREKLMSELQKRGIDPLAKYNK